MCDLVQPVDAVGADGGRARRARADAERGARLEEAALAARDLCLLVARVAFRFWHIGAIGRDGGGRGRRSGGVDGWGVAPTGGLCGCGKKY